MTKGGEGGGEQGAESDDSKKASINHSILSYATWADGEFALEILPISSQQWSIKGVDEEKIKLSG
jgi:hypothetical protein